jgi:predicted metal-dependent hydrolase
MSDVIDTIHIDGVGPVVFCKSRRARRIVIYISPDGVVRVSVPARAVLDRALEFVTLKKGWIRKHQLRFEQTQKIDDGIEDRLRKIDKVEAANNLISRIRMLAGKHGFTVNRVTVREQRTRWGACSPHNNISLNLKLFLLPDELTDYVILHELVHTVHHNHSKQFWKELDKYIPQSKLVSKRLKSGGLTLP